MAAAQKVFGTAELFELILTEMDMKTLLLAQRVDSHWQATIASSMRLQKKLFFVTATPEDLLLLRIADPEPNSHTLLVNQSTYDAATHDKLGIAGIPATDLAQVNPFYTRRTATEPLYERTIRSPGSGRVTSHPQFQLPAKFPVKVIPNTGTARPSWLRMLISQPPSISCVSSAPASLRRGKCAQDLFSSDPVARCSVAMDGITMQGRYYWNAVRRNTQRLSEKTE